MLKATKTKQYILMICPSQLSLKNPWSMDNIKNIWVINSIIHFWKEILHLVVFLEWCGKGLTSKRETVVILHSTEEVILSNSMFLVKYTWAWCPGAWLVHLVTLHWKKKFFFSLLTRICNKNPLGSAWEFVLSSPALCGLFCLGQSVVRALHLDWELQRLLSQCCRLVLFNIYWKEQLKQPPCSFGLLF